MRTKHFLGLLSVSLAMFAQPAAAQTPDGLTPAVETVCGDDKFAGATPGLQGLCVAMCEAQDCEPIEDELGTVTFPPSCNASAPQILANYEKLKNRDKEDNDPPMPCVRVVCTCWTESQIESMGGGTGDYCDEGTKYLSYNGHSSNGSDLAYVYDFGSQYSDSRYACTSTVTGYQRPISELAYQTCRDSIEAKCASLPQN
jgi:hypothetical protein